MEKELQAIYDGLEGEWVRTIVDDVVERIVFFKPPNNSTIGKLEIYAMPENKLIQTVEYEVLRDDNGIVYIDRIIKSVGQIIQTKQEISFMNSWIGFVDLTNHDGRRFRYDRSQPRKLDNEIH